MKMKSIKKLSLLKFQMALAFFLLLTASPSYAQQESGKWSLKISYASMKPFIKNDLWYVTAQGYHIHPRTESYTPGIAVGVEYEFLKRAGVELMLLYGRPTACLGIVDQFSTREPIFKKGYNFYGILLSPNIAFIKKPFGKIYAGPVCGWGATEEVSIVPDFGPEVTWAKENEFIYGVKAGMKLRIKRKKIYFNTELMYVSLKARITATQTNRALDKTFGPFGILLGLVLPLHEK